VSQAEEVITDPEAQALEHKASALLGGMDIAVTDEIAVPPMLVDQVIGQEQAVEVIKKAAKQRRHVMLIGSPGTGKSMLARSMAELLPKEELQDILVYHNPEDGNSPKVRVVPAGKGRQIVDSHKREAQKKIQFRNMLSMVIVFAIVGYSFAINQPIMGIIAAAMLFIALRYITPREDVLIPKLLVMNDGKETAPYIDGTGAHAGALLGDVRHDPFQSGGLETPAHDRVEAGAIHKANKGVLFIDEIATTAPYGATRGGVFHHRPIRALKWRHGKNDPCAVQFRDDRCRKSRRREGHASRSTLANPRLWLRSVHARFHAGYARKSPKDRPVCGSRGEKGREDPPLHGRCGRRNNP
jgi:energy-coupling factor transporter ATP-binding protein EcfA2